MTDVVPGSTRYLSTCDVQPYGHCPLALGAVIFFLSIHQLHMWAVVPDVVRKSIPGFLLSRDVGTPEMVSRFALLAIKVDKRHHNFSKAVIVSDTATTWYLLTKRWSTLNLLVTDPLINHMPTQHLSGFGTSRRFITADIGSIENLKSQTAGIRVWNA